jgi:signal transduction histidine kinase
MLEIHLLLAGIVGSGSTTIARQQAELREKVAQLTELLAQNEKLSSRVRAASARTAAFNERFLRRISAELHDCPAQDLAFALLRLDSIGARSGGSGAADEAARPTAEEIGKIEGSLAHALRELRAVTAGLRLPDRIYPARDGVPSGPRPQAAYRQPCRAADGRVAGERTLIGEDHRLSGDPGGTE